MKKWLLVGLMLLSGLTSAASTLGNEFAPILGKEYTMLAAPQPVAIPKKIEVIEFFSYSCSHCKDLQPLMDAWARQQPADVNFRRVQIVWGPQMEGFAKFFATMNELGLAARLNDAAFNAVWQKRINIGDPAALETWLKSQSGVDVKKFMATFNSFGTNAKLAAAKQMTRDYAIQGTPTLIVNGKYVLSPVPPAALIQNLDQVVAMVRKSGK